MKTEDVGKYVGKKIRYYRKKNKILTKYSITIILKMIQSIELMHF